ncbi:hypothetical protein [Streptomyces sp. A012304]|uniref:hypothetical protein n=1 Tax=Streptomyces sp. A012304 TaxID=375446 RepID=UPI0022303937|nr:hypothetical protein [Streptomyces sp. A012304]GKQ40322.1 transferase [Streptomyces sp. A012304]
MTTNSWESLQRKLEPNPQQFMAWPIMIGGMGATALGVAFVVFNLGLLFGVDGLPVSFEDLRNASSWRLILGIACLHACWSVINHGNNLFGVYRPAGYSWCLSGAFGFVVVARDVVMTAMDLSTTVAALRDAHTAAVLFGGLLAGMLLLRLGNRRFARARRYLAPVVREPEDLRGLDYGLYLRTFRQDRALSGAQPFTPAKRAVRSLFVVELTEEAMLADALTSDIAPMVAVGRPGEPAPPVGALRVYLPGEDWQSYVRGFIEGAGHVVLALGWGEGTLWELRESMRILRPEQLILVVPMDEAEYERFRKETAKSLPAALPAYAGQNGVRSAIRGLITFSEDWKPTFVPVRAYSPFHNSLRIALYFAAWPALRRLGHPPRGVARLAPNAIK